MFISFRCCRLISPLMRKRFIVTAFAVTFAVYMYLLHSAHALHSSKTSFSPMCQPVAAESSRAIQILKELQVCLSIFVLFSNSCLIRLLGTNAVDVRLRKLRFFQPFSCRRQFGLGNVTALSWHSKLDVRKMKITSSLNNVGDAIPNVTHLW